MAMRYATGYAVEPYHFIDLLEQYGGVLPSEHGDMRRMVRICQIESRNPHLHADKGDAHVADMIIGSLATIYHSRLCPASLQKKIDAERRQGGYLQDGEKLQPVRVYPSLAGLSMDRFAGGAQEIVDRRFGAPPLARPALRRMARPGPLGWHDAVLDLLAAKQTNRLSP